MHLYSVYTNPEITLMRRMLGMTCFYHKTPRHSSLLSLPPVTCTRLPVMNEPSCEASST